MRLKDEILKALETTKDDFISGEVLASSFKVSRNAVSKTVASLKSDGYVIESKTNKGYKLVSSNVKSSKYGILKYLKSEGIDIRVIETTDSTNTQLKKDAESGASEWSVLVSESQTGGRGRTGKSFLSPSGTGVYMSILLRPKISAEDSLCITACAAVAVSEAIEEISGKEVKIKWVNDIFCETKKICGILTEASLDIESGGLNYVILGIGVNVFAPKDGFGEYDDIAGALFSVSQNNSEIKNRLIASIIDHFMRYYSNMKLTRGARLADSTTKEASEKEREDKKESNEISEITELLKFLFSKFSDYAKKIETRIDSLQVIVGGEDSAEIAKKYGVYSGGVSYLVEILNNKTRLIPPKKEKIFVKADFLSQSTSFTADFSLSVRVIFVVKFLIDFLSSKA